MVPRKRHLELSPSAKVHKIWIYIAADSSPLLWFYPRISSLVPRPLSAAILIMSVKMAIGSGLGTRLTRLTELVVQ